MRLSGTKTGAVNQYRGLGNQLWDLAGNRPSLDLPFSDTKSLVDTTTGKTLVDHTRASSGTYVGSDGLIKTATTNLLSWSEDFTNAVWQTTNPGEVTVITGVADPLGGVNATTLFRDSGAGDTGWLRRVNTGTIGLSYTFSFWIRRRSGSGDFIAVVGDNINQTISGITSEWQRVSVSNVPTSTTLRTYFQVNSPGDEFDIFGAQLEQSSTVGEYIPTTSTINSAPRFDHDPTTGESFGLLVEESRTNELPWSENFANPQYIPILSAIGATNLPAPDGTNTATLLLETDTTGEHYIQDTLPSGKTGTVTHSVFVKAAGRNFADLRMVHVGESANTSSARVDLTTGQITLTEGLTPTASVQAFPNGWYRVSVAVTLTGANTTYGFRVHTVDSATGNRNYAGDPTKGILIWGAQSENGAFPTSYIKNAGTTLGVTRAADVADISGNNFGAFNLLQYSEEFDSAAWSAYAGVVITPNSIESPTGTLTADLVDFGAPDRILQQNITGISGVPYTGSIWVKGTAGETIRLGGSGITGASNKTLTGSWDRLSFTGTSSSTSLSLFLSTFAGATARNIYVWGAQLEQSDVVTPYIKSDVTFTSRASSATYYDKDGVIQTAAVDEARTNAYLPDDSGNLVSAGELLLEGAGTNLLLRSEEFETWWVAQRASVSSNATIAPNGTPTADEIIEDTTATNTHRIYSGGVQPAGTYTITVYAKASARSHLYIAQESGGNSLFTLTGTGTAVALGANTVSITNVGNGWYRCASTYTATGNHFIYLSVHNGTSHVYTGDGTSGLYIWGAQLEASPYATSYIPTAGSQATRAADVSTSSSNTFGNSWYRQDEGTFRANSFAPQGVILFGTADTFDNTLYVTANPTFNVSIRSGGQSSATLTAPVSRSAASNVAVVYKVDDFAAVSDGGAVQTDNLGPVPVSQLRLKIGSSPWSTGAGNDLNGTISRLTYWPTRLPNETLQTITN